MERDDDLLHFYWKNRATDEVVDVGLILFFSAYHFFKIEVPTSIYSLFLTLLLLLLLLLSMSIHNTRISFFSQETQNLKKYQSVQQDEFLFFNSNLLHKNYSFGFRKQTRIGMRSLFNKPIHLLIKEKPLSLVMRTSQCNN